MPARLLDGTLVAAVTRKAVHEETARLAEHGVRPGLAAVIVGDDLPSRIYVRTKRKACEEAGIYTEEHALPTATTEAVILTVIARLNADPKIHGILVQLPLPGHLRTDRILDAVVPEKDVDGLHPVNAGRLFRGDPAVLPCTPAGIMALLEHYRVPLEGRRAAVVGRSYLVGKPVALLLMQHHATVTICHSRTKDLAEVCRSAEILIAAVGQPQVITAEMVRDDAVVVDVGINRLSDGRLVGDVDFERVRQKAGWLTPVPGGVGPMTVAMLLKNTLAAATRRLAPR